MIIGAHSIIYSKAPQADRVFLRDVLELPSVDVGDGWLIFGLPPAEVAVHPAEENDVHELYLMCADVEAFALTLGLVPARADAEPPPSAIVVSEFIYDRAPFPSAHASTVVETRDGLLAAWFGGTAEGRPDVGIWCARRSSTGWSAPVEVATGAQPDGKRLPCWNPVL